LKQQLGASGNRPVPADYDGDGITDMAVWDPSSGFWKVIRSADGSQTMQQLGYSWRGDMPAPADFDGDGRADFAVWRSAYPSGTIWFIHRSRDNSQDSTVLAPIAGAPSQGGVPVPADYDGDKRADIAMWNWGTWQILQSSDGKTVTRGGGDFSDAPVPGDYDGDGKADFAYWRPSTGAWWISKSGGGPQTIKKLGQTGDVPAPGDFDAPQQ
jgi:hypothetical protein